MKFLSYRTFARLAFVAAVSSPGAALAATSIAVGEAAPPAAPVPAIAPSALPADFMRAADIKPGMKLVGKTCFSGTDIIEFKGVILGTERGAFAGSDLIWAELEGFGEHGVAGGMSGSPCYIDGKLIGAVAYGFTGAQKPIAGISPIERMYEVFELTNDKDHANERDRTNGASGSGGGGRGVWDLEQLREMSRNAAPPRAEPMRVLVRDLPTILRQEAGPGADSVEIQPLSAPIGVSNVAPQTYAYLQTFLNSRGLQLASGAFSKGTVEASSLPPIVAGSAMGVPMVTGDLTLGSIGTATYVDGNRIVGFGHPAYGWGNADIPLSPCVMLTIMPSYQRSFKVGQVATPVGSVRQDRNWGVGGVIGRQAPMFPLSVHIVSPHSGVDQTFHYMVWNNRFYSANLSQTGMTEALASAERTDGDTTTRVSYTIELEGSSEPIRKSVYMAATTGPAGSIFDVFDDMSLLSNNPFREGRFKNVSVEVVIDDQIHLGSIISVTADKEVYRPGQTMDLTVYIQPYQGKLEKRSLAFELPNDLVDGSYDLFVGDSAARLRLERNRAPGIFTPMDFDQIVRASRMHFVSNKMFLVLSKDSMGLTVQGQELPALPGSLLSILATSEERAFIRPTTAEFIKERAVSDEMELSGSHMLNVNIDHAGRRN